MGNYFQKEIICDECKSQNIEPKYFTKKILSNDEEAILIERIERYDKYGNIIIEPEKKIPQKIIQYTCSNNHVFYLNN